MKNTKTTETWLMLIWVQSLVATLGSLFFSEIMGYVPCELCWIQRIFMYPLVIIYGTALFKKDVSIALPGLILSGIGIFVSLYHYLVQKLPDLHVAGGSCGAVPCNTEYVNYFGFVTIPFLAGIAFIVIVVLHTVLLKKSRSGRN
ncbi:disulfide oxidoreductase [Lentibacillus salicampi]|uniref:Probable disulfide formation protein n=1 Tax=Lentibacillus salicampi TaxID=175306 RepID=A0A4Y9ACB2_9BACI|nr:disulfide oxidoreductase [Lentibacillus salicampi]TFJ93538.1 disulfide bond formation protein B [Lentibacillus salicampi]